MKVTFLRLGHSNNSSSAHSLLFSNKDIPKENDESLNFGWDRFTCSNREAKTNYLVSCFVSCLKRSFGLGYVVGGYGKDEYSLILQELRKGVDEVTEWACERIVRELLEISQFDKGGYVDHQSAITFPLVRSGASPHFDFAKNFIAEFVNNNWYVFGGNDNKESRSTPPADDQPDFTDFKKVWAFLKDQPYGSVLCVKDEKTEEYVLSKNGGLIKIKF